MLGRCCYHDLAKAQGSCEEDVVEALVQKVTSNIGSALNNSNRVPIQIVGKASGQNRRGFRAQFRRLENGTIASRDCANQRAHDQIEGIVPGRHDQCDTQWLINDLTRAWLVIQNASLHGLFQTD